MNKVQQAAFDLIREDARFLYAITDIKRNAKNIDSNYICMSLPYIGLFADGAEQWCKKIGLNAPTFNPTEKHIIRNFVKVTSCLKNLMSNIERNC